METSFRNLNVIILAGGLGKRMESTLPKVCHQVANKPMVVHVIETARKLHPSRIFVVVGKYQETISNVIQQFTHTEDITFIDQPNAQGTGHAVQCCLPYLNALDQSIILYGDTPLIKEKTLSHLLEIVTPTKMITTMLENPFGYGRIIKDIESGDVLDIVEEKDCSPDQKLIQTVNTGIYVFPNSYLIELLPLLTNNNAQNEYYLTDMIKLIKTHKQTPIGLYYLPKKDQIEITGVNTKTQLEELNQLVKNIIC